MTFQVGDEVRIRGDHRNGGEGRIDQVGHLNDSFPFRVLVKGVGDHDRFREDELELINTTTADGCIPFPRKRSK